MHERAALLGGTLEIESARLKGTTVIARMPMRFEENQSRAQREKRRA
jgi:glucose-6-phosphate-specific signal transduction histidine kinase